MIKFRMYSSRSDHKMKNMIDKLSSISLGNIIFEEINNGIIAKVDDGVKIYHLKRLIMNDKNIWEVHSYRQPYPDDEPARSYASALCELINALNGKGWDEGIDFINRLSKKK